MKICHINTLPFGGAAKVALRLHKSLLTNSFDSFLLFGGKVYSGERIIPPYSGIQKYFASSLAPYIDYLPLKFFSKKKDVEKWSISWRSLGVHKTINKNDFDLVNIHWIGNGFLGLNEFRKIKAKKVFTLHDSWAFTGGCHIPYDCTRYMSNCGRCPQLESNKNKDISSWGLKLKESSFKKENIIFVTPSDWLHRRAKKSKLLKDREIYTIPNGIDLDIFKPYDKNICKEILGLNKDKIVIVFSAVNNINDKLKGFHLLTKALELINNADIEILVLGSNKPSVPLNIKFPVYFLGPIYDEYTLTVAYSAADITVVPSISESLSLTSVESLACGTPVVAFEVGGIPEVIDHKLNGWLAPAFDVQSFAEGINWCINNLSSKDIFESARKKAEEKFDINAMRLKYLDLYKSLLIKK